MLQGSYLLLRCSGPHYPGSEGFRHMSFHCIDNTFYHWEWTYRGLEHRVYIVLEVDALFLFSVLFKAFLSCNFFLPSRVCLLQRSELQHLLTNTFLEIPKLTEPSTHSLAKTQDFMSTAAFFEEPGDKLKSL